MSNKSKQWCIDGTACVSIDPARIAFNMSAPFFLIAIFILKSSHRCMLFKHTNVQCHCASTISRIALKRYSKEHRYSTLFAIIWKSHVTSAKEKEKKKPCEMRIQTIFLRFSFQEMIMYSTSDVRWMLKF